jgi:acyl-coenzyme A synthetase/AMP-(fatty) acid ligase
VVCPRVQRKDAMSEVAEAGSNVASTWIDAPIASNRGDSHAFAFGTKRYSYQDVAALMNRAANMLRAAGVEPGARLLLLLPGSPAMVASLLGAIKAGVVPIVGLPSGDAEQVQQCVQATSPAAAVVHQDWLAASGDALAGVPDQSLIVVGNEVQRGKSFVEDIRSQSSWFPPQQVSGSTPALGIWSGSSLREFTHAQLAQLVQSDTPEGEAAGVAPLIAMLRAFAKGEQAILP